MRSPEGSSSAPNCLKTTLAPANMMNAVDAGAPWTPPDCQDKRCGNGVRALALARCRHSTRPEGRREPPQDGP
eukprot:9400162-Pyramimonas_sp.AAC.1